MADNILDDIPYNVIAKLKALHVLDLSYNIIESILPETLFVNNPLVIPKARLDTLNLGFNQIKRIPTAAFSNFEVVNITYLDGNPIYELENEAFRSVEMRELYIRFCGLTHISPNAFDGMATTLQHLDLSGNNITELPNNFLKNFDDFRYAIYNQAVIFTIYFTILFY